MAEPAGRGYVLKEFSFRVAEHAIWNERSKIWLAGADVKVQPAIVVQITKVHTHRDEHMIDVRFAADVGECPVAIFAEEPGTLGFCPNSKVICEYIAAILDHVVGDKKVRPTVIIVIEKPARKTVDRLRDPCRR